MTPDIPSERDSIIMDFDHFCEEHLNQAGEFDIPPINTITVTIEALLEHPEFYEICYRIKNGYGIPEGMDIESVPDGEAPDVQHINDAIREVEPLCCYLEEKSEQDHFIKAIAKQAQDSDNWG